MKPTDINENFFEPARVHRELDQWNKLYKTGIPYLHRTNGLTEGLENFLGDGFIASFSTEDWSKLLYKDPVLADECRAKVSAALKQYKAHHAQESTARVPADGLDPEGQQAHVEVNTNNVNILEFVESNDETATKAAAASNSACSEAEQHPAKREPTVEEPKRPATEPKQDVEGTKRSVEEDGTDASLDESKFTKCSNKWIKLVGDGEITRCEFVVLCVISSFCFGNKRECFPSKRTIASRVGLRADNFGSVVKSLEQKGLLEVIKDGGKIIYRLP